MILSNRQCAIVLAALGHYACADTPRTEHFDDLPAHAGQDPTPAEVDALRESIACGDHAQADRTIGSLSRVYLGADDPAAAQRALLHAVFHAGAMAQAEVERDHGEPPVVVRGPDTWRDTPAGGYRFAQLLDQRGHLVAEVAFDEGDAAQAATVAALAKAPEVHRCLRNLLAFVEEAAQAGVLNAAEIASTPAVVMARRLSGGAL